MAAKTKTSAKKAAAKPSKPAAKKGAVKTLTSALARLVKPAAKKVAKPAKAASGKAAAAKKAAAKPAAKAAKPTKPAAAKKPAAKKAAPARNATPAKPAAKASAKPAVKAPAKAPAKAKPTPVTKKAVEKKPAAPGKAATPVKVAASQPALKSSTASAPAAAKAKTKNVPVQPVKDESPAKPVKAAGSNAGKAMATGIKARVVARPNEGGIKAKAVKPSKPANSNDVPPLALPARVDLPDGYKPASGDGEYMNPLHLEYFRQKLLNWRADLVEESKQTIDNLREEVRDVGDEAERATRETENSLELRTRDRYRKLIGKIDKALKRIDDGAYGYCEETGEEIGIERLEARPIATLCLDAQERWEHRQKLMGD